MKHYASPRFWAAYNQLPLEVRQLADKNFALIREDPGHPSLRFKSAGHHWSARVESGYRVLASRRGDEVLWFWIGTHADYDGLLR